MNRTLRLLALIVIGLFVFLISGCSSRSRPYIELDGIGFSGQFGRLNKRSDPVRHVQGGARLILAYDLQSRSITGHVENMTHQTLKRVRVTVRLSNGIKLGSNACSRPFARRNAGNQICRDRRRFYGLDGAC